MSVHGLLPLLDHHHGLGLPPRVPLGLGLIRCVTKFIRSNHQEFQTLLGQAGWRPPDITLTLLAPELFICLEPAAPSLAAGFLGPEQDDSQRKTR